MTLGAGKSSVLNRNRLDKITGEVARTASMARPTHPDHEVPGGCSRPGAVLPLDVVLLLRPGRRDR